MIDSHCHLDRLTGLETVLAAAKLAGIEYLLCPGIDLQHFPQVLALAKNYPNIGASVGLHPTEAEPAPEYTELLALAQDSSVLAIGETGLDYAQCANLLEVQKQQQALLELHIAVAKAVHKPLIIHARNADRDIINILRALQAESGVFHCFTGDWDLACQALDLGFYISLAGIITFKNADALRAVAKKIPLERLLIETDAPYLAPVPMRGKTNVPAYLRYIAEELAKLRNITYNELVAQTTANFWRLFQRVQ